MNENLILVVDYENICRLCLHTTGAMSDLFEKNKGNTLKDFVLRATGLEIEQHDGLPSKICYRCRYIVELTCELRDMVDKTNMLLVNAGNHIDVKDEHEDISEKAITTPKIGPKKYLSKEKNPDLRLIMQDNGIMRLVKTDPGPPLDEKMENIGEKNKDIIAKNKEYVYSEENFKIFNRSAPPKKLTCQICLASFPSAGDVNSHANEHYINSSLTPYTKLQRPFRCEVCDRTVSKPQLISHHRSHLNINPFVCKQDGCHFVGKSQDALRRHLQIHSARSQMCEHCGAAYKRRFELRQHMLRSHRAAPAHCGLCRKRFRNAITFQTHMLLYHKPRRHKCTWPGCSKAYPVPGALAVHMRAHADDRAFRCHLCEHAAYTSQWQLNRHVRMHERARLSKCDKCSLSFDDYGAFYSHRVSAHGHWLRHHCTTCHKKFQLKETLESHLQVCEQASAPSGGQHPQTDESTQHVPQEIMNSEKTLELEEEDRAQGKITEDLLDKFRGQSLLVQPGNINDLSKDLELQDLPPDGLLYIEVDSEGEDTWQQ